MVTYVYLSNMKDMVVMTPSGFIVLLLLSSLTVYAIFGDIIQNKFRTLFHKLDKIMR